MSADDQREKARVRQENFRKRKKHPPTIRTVVKQKLAADPITKSDNQQLKRLRNGKPPEPPSKASREFDQDFAGDDPAAGEAAAGGGPDHADGPPDGSGEGAGVSQG